MANETMTLLSTVTVGAGGAASIDFTSIPATYTDLVVKASIRVNTTGATYSNLYISFNGSTTGFSNRILYGLAGSVASANTSGASLPYSLYGTTNTNTANTFASGELYIPNYTSSNNKSVSSDSVNENNAADGGFNNISAGLWANSAAINQITISGVANFVQYSTASLYGIKSGSGGATVS